MSALNVLCVSSYFKGVDFIKAMAEAGHNVFLLTGSELKDEQWPWECLTDSYFMDIQEDGTWVMEHLTAGIAYRMREVGFDKFVALDDFDVEQVAHLREHFRIPGMGSTTARYFRDKLAMRMKAQEHDIPVPRFTSLFLNQAVNDYADAGDAPWLIKPRSEASATGIKKIHSKEELWQVVDSLGDKRPSYLVEKFAPGDVYHVDSLVYQGEVLFSNVSRYLDTPFEVAHGGGIFRSMTVEKGSEDDVQLQKLNSQVMEAFGMINSASHTEFIKDKESGKFFFLETSARVGGANLAEMVETATGINLWREWAKIEHCVSLNEPYKLPAVNSDYAGIVVSLSKFQHPDTTSFQDTELVWRMNKDWHIGLIVRSQQSSRIAELLDHYTQRIAQEFHASVDPPDAARV